MTRNVSDDASNTDKTALVGADRFLVINSETNPDSLVEITKTNLTATSAQTLAGTSTAIFVTPAGLASVVANLPQGMLWNGKISPTVSSNNLTVALKTLAGSDPSASDPVYVRIGDTVRTITSAKSVTKNAGTNWCNAGGTELATFEVDYFVYLGYNATDGVTIGFSRIPYAARYDDFHATSTNEKYAAISTITNAAAADYYQNVGRFAATLSAGAGYTWSVPTYTATNLVNRPIYETRWLSWNGVVTSGSGTITTVGTDFFDYQVIGRNVLFQVVIPITTNGTGATSLIHTLPFTPAGIRVAAGRETVATGNSLHGVSSTNTIVWRAYDNSYPMADGRTLVGSGDARWV